MASVRVGGAASEVVVVGGGIVGCATAWELARAGARVTLVERGEIGREASWAGAGVLTPLHPWSYPEPLIGLCRRALAGFARTVAELADLTGIDPEFRAHGLVLPIRGAAEAAEVERHAEWRRAHGWPAERWSPADLLREEPEVCDAAVAVPASGPGAGAVASPVSGALFLPDAAQVRNPRLVRALAAAAVRAGATLRPGFPVTGLALEGGRVVGVQCGGERLAAGSVVLAGGAWTSLLPEAAARGIAVRPVRGQIVLLRTFPPRLRRMVLAGREYLVPRADGRVLVGSTVEEAGFDKSTTAEAVAHLLRRAAEMAPALARAAVETVWSGLRPATGDRLPYLGAVPEVAGLWVAAGHFRNGLLLGPLTGRLVADLVLGRTPDFDLAPFRVGRPRGGLEV